MTPEPALRAAGGVVVRRRGSDVELVVVHRPEYGDWTLPKGKCEPDEDWAECALREVAEETSLRCRLLGSAGTTSYTDQKGRSKEVRWWLMRPESGELAGATEVDVARWVSPVEALAALSYNRDRELLEPLLRETRLWVLRHADAGDAARWKQPDRLRPLNRAGRDQAEKLARLLGGERLDRLVSSPLLRCVQTLEPLAAATGHAVEHVAELGEGHRLRGIVPLLAGGGSVVACTHGDVLDGLLRELGRDSLAQAGAATPKAAGWALRARAGLVLSARYLPPPA
jgi:8-oxo-dGTP diphosphatase